MIRFHKSCSVRQPKNQPGPCKKSVKKVKKEICAMETMEQQIQKVLSSVFTSHDACFKDTDGPNEILGWDSLNHLNLVMAINNEFGINLGFEEMLEIRNVGNIKIILKRHNLT